MPKQEKRPADEKRDRPMDPKVAFDRGYNSYENGNDECDFGVEAERSPTDPVFCAIWRSGWRRAHEDSALSRREVQVE